MRLLFHISLQWFLFINISIYAEEGCDTKRFFTNSSTLYMQMTVCILYFVQAGNSVGYCPRVPITPHSSQQQYRVSWNGSSTDRSISDKFQREILRRKYALLSLRMKLTDIHALSQRAWHINTLCGTCTVVLWVFNPILLPAAVHRKDQYYAKYLAHRFNLADVPCHHSGSFWNNFRPFLHKFFVPDDFLFHTPVTACPFTGNFIHKLGRKMSFNICCSDSTLCLKRINQNKYGLSTDEF